MHSYIKRRLRASIVDYLEQFPAAAVLGPRQCGKSTLARSVVQEGGDALYLDLESPADLRKLDEPELYLTAHSDKLVCLDEIQRRPDLFPALRGVLDRGGRPGQLLLLGSASRDLLAQSSESLAGRIGYLELTPFGLDEVAPAALEPDADSLLRRLWLRGGFPPSTLANTDAASLRWRYHFIRTFVERDLPQLGVRTPSPTISRFWRMCAHLHAQLLNASRLGEALGVSHTSVRRYLDALAETYVIRLLPPFATNGGKRLVRAPKVYLRDSGLLHALLDIESTDQLYGHPVFGASWEGLVIDNILARLGDGWRASHYRTASGVEIDLLLERGRRRVAVECKASASPSVSKGFWLACEDLGVDAAWVVAPVSESYPLRPPGRVTTLPDIIERAASDRLSE